MTTPATIRKTEHSVSVNADPGEVYRLIADVSQWPRMFPPTIHAEQTGIEGQQEQIRLWATANGEVKTWISRRWLDPGARSVRFRQEVSQPPVAEMGGTWLVEPNGGTGCLVRLLHDYRAVDDDPEAVAWIERAVDRNSHAELAALREAAELAVHEEELLFTFDDSVRVDGSARDTYEFIYDAGRWTERLPHVVRVRLSEDTPNIQELEMDTRAMDGSAHTTSSVRICFPHRDIWYKQTVVPALMTVHTGRWLFVEDVSGVTVTSRHTVVLNPPSVPGVLGKGATIADARDFVREALGKNSLATLNHAKNFAETRRRGPARGE